MQAYSTKIHELKAWYERYERHISSVSLLFGFVFDSLTLQRIDALRENIWIAFNLLLVGVCIVILNRRKNPLEPGTWKHFFLFNTLQFGFGALLGAFFIFYFQSSTLAVSWPFLLVLLLAMIANEMFQKRYALLALQISYFYLSLYAFAIFIIPILLHRIGPWIFILSGAVSLLFVWFYLRILRVFAREVFRESRIYIFRVVAAIFIGMNLLYFANFIPAIPLSLKDSGVYHNIARNRDGSYAVLSEERRGLLRFFDFKNEISWVPGRPLYAYTAVYSPTLFNTSIVHEWQYRDSLKKEWVTTTRIPLGLTGGRVAGFRTYSEKSALTPGRWRVNVRTSRGQFIGRINFEIVVAQTPPELQTYTKD
jgi:hypothetical protein